MLTKQKLVATCFHRWLCYRRFNKGVLMTHSGKNYLNIRQSVFVTKAENASAIVRRHIICTRMTACHL